MSYPESPQHLTHMQHWFADIITTPLDQEEKISPFSKSGRSVIEEAELWIKKSPTLKPHQRIEIYNQQYWWRLFHNLKDDFPFLSRLFPIKEFQETIARPYLEKYPPSHFSLTEVGRHLSQWFIEDYKGNNREYLSTIAHIDYAYNFIYSAKKGESIAHIDKEKLFLMQLTLSPQVALFTFNGKLFSLREEMLKQPHNYWHTNPFPKLNEAKNKFYYLLFRNYSNVILYKHLSKAEYILLKNFQQKSSLSDMLNSIDNLPEYLPEIEMHLSEWITCWISEYLLEPC